MKPNTGNNPASPLRQYEQNIAQTVSYFDPDPTPIQLAANRAFELANGATPRPVAEAHDSPVVEIAQPEIPAYVLETQQRAIAKRAEREALGPLALSAQVAQVEDEQRGLEHPLVVHALQARKEADERDETALPRSQVQAETVGSMNTYYLTGKTPGREVVDEISEEPGKRFDSVRGYKVPGTWFRVAGREWFVPFDDRGDNTYDARVAGAKAKLRNGQGRRIKDKK